MSEIHNRVHFDNESKNIDISSPIPQPFQEQVPRRAKLGFGDVWKAMKTEKHFNHGYWLQVSLSLLVHQFMRNFGIVLVAFATVLISCIAYAGFFILLPIVAQPYTIIYCWHIICGIFLLYAVYFSYVMVVFTSPGDTLEESFREEDVFAFSPELPSIDAMNELSLLRSCNKCEIIKPPRSHHCSVCDKCVIKMDHHCPWINNCVGHGNYRYFISFMLYVSLATGYIAIAIFPHVKSGLFSTITLPALGIDLHSAQANIPPLLQAQPDPQGPMKPFEVIDVDKRDPNIKMKGIANKLALENNDHITDNDDGGALQNLRYFWDFVKMIAFPPKEVKNEVLIRQYAEAEAAATLDASHQKSRQLSTTVLDGIHQKHRGKSFFEQMRLPPKTILNATFAMCIGICISVGGLCSFHIWLVTKNLTTVELFMRNNGASRDHWHNPYDLGSKMANFQSVFGNLPWYIAILPLKRKAPRLKISNYVGPGGSVWDGSCIDRKENWLNYYEIKAAYNNA